MSVQVGQRTPKNNLASLETSIFFWDRVWWTCNCKNTRKGLPTPSSNRLRFFL